MLSDYLNGKVVSINAEAKDAKDAIRIAGQLLVDAHKVSPKYVESMINVYQELGPYIVIAPGIALPHSKPCDDVYETCMSFCLLKNPIVFNHPNNDPVRYLFALGGRNEHDHLEMLKELSRFLMDQSNIDALSNIHDKEEFIELVKKGGK